VTFFEYTAVGIPSKDHRIRNDASRVVGSATKVTAGLGVVGVGRAKSTAANKDIAIVVVRTVKLFGHFGEGLVS